jgi:hypothetical protein
MSITIPGSVYTGPHSPAETARPLSPKQQDGVVEYESWLNLLQIMTK